MRGIPYVRARVPCVKENVFTVILQGELFSVTHTSFLIHPYRYFCKRLSRSMRTTLRNGYKFKLALLLVSERMNST